MDQRSRYYQTVARTFLFGRGAPFILSSKEIDVIRSWEVQGIPLRVVLEGINNFFEKPGTGSRRKRKGASLVFCDSFIQKTFLMSRTREVGREQNIKSRSDKKSAVRKRIEHFSKSFPEEIISLKNEFQAALLVLEEPDPDEEKLEELDRTVDGKLIQNASDSLVKSIRNEVFSDYPGIKEEEANRIVRIKLSRTVREKFHIPRFSLYYY